MVRRYGGTARPDAVEVADRDGDHHPDLIVGAYDERVRVCGQDKALLEPRALDPKTLALRPVVLNRAWILASKARSPSSDTVTPGPRAKEGGRIPLCRVGRIAEPASAGGVAVEAAL